MNTLKALLDMKYELEELLSDADTYTNTLEEIWQNNEIELKSKIDAYGYVIDKLKAENELLKNRKAKITQLQNKINSEIESIKSRLNYLSDGKPLKGNEYSFYPYLSVKSNSINYDLVEPEYFTYVVELDYDTFQKIKPYLVNITVNKKVNVSDLPENHPAVIKEIKPSVRIK